MTTPTEAEALRAAFDRMLAIGDIAAKLITSGMNPIQAHIVAGDQLSATEATERVKNGSDPLREVYRVGSYARLEWALQNIPHHALLSRFLVLWRDSDPDDTKPKYLKLWKELQFLHRPYPAMDTDHAQFDKLPSVLRIYRGQVASLPVGVAWTLDWSVAQKFAHTGGSRVGQSGGTVLVRYVRKDSVLGYITGRSEHEVVVDPALLSSD